MEDKSVKKRSKLVKVLLVVAGVSFVVMFISFVIGMGTSSGWEPTFSFINYSSTGLFLASIIGIVIVFIWELFN